MTQVACRVCTGSTQVILDMGTSPVANALLADPMAQAKQYPLGLCQCDDCGLVQNTTSLPTATLFGADYPYYSGVSQTVRQHAAGLAKQIATRVGRGATAFEIGSNDGTLQLALAQEGINCIGIDPAAGPVAAANDAGCTAYCGVLDAQMAEKVTREHGQVDVVTMSNVLAHMAAPTALLKQVRSVVKPGGLLVIEAQSWLDLVQAGAFDMVYHEHHSHFSLSTLAACVGAAGFGIVDALHVPAQGGSLRVFCELGAAHSPNITAAIAQAAPRVKLAPAQLRAKLDGFRTSAAQFADETSGKRVAGYGAAAKTVSLLAACDLTMPLTCVADLAPSKIGKFLPIANTPIVAPDEMLADRPDAIILFAWNLQAEILPKLQGFDVWLPLPQLAKVA
ncbi:class I SAM-dependent methyltransferase [Yoonia sp. I 8.24]|uniref:class I SAM-dependent methyltransferase n=1 Tax=Yoonia sp. I 8.24 TaxID=1537229 RepID=UPI001EE06896|nr:class I SAM-dependent methyltransferase [Yoonia sp. I 8.24]MCG3267179.1 methyltransferase domain-containing protein [Yoonia sp. I 8.24]